MVETVGSYVFRIQIKNPEILLRDLKFPKRRLAWMNTFLTI
jgi:hypothetical protein